MIKIFLVTFFPSKSRDEIFLFNFFRRSSPSRWLFVYAFAITRPLCIDLVWFEGANQAISFVKFNKNSHKISFLAPFRLSEIFLYFILLFLRDLYVDGWAVMVCVSVDIVRLIHAKCLCDSCLRLTSTVEICLYFATLCGESGER